ncbi:carboxymuconolactone decarboxylase family protein [Rhizobiales bacterium]|uniref:carboxymuconolactone decarboxylase family protein n=1 Tax=Hongsoonwoonella zoysiae TaxID=2821844 RepID=UPI001560ACAC|nr:carboxymuconolactone decarboxylase family protein [Hongsoonwoonella zoysiae]NRG16494.1 carboxymuconolactone decarboxylase family protein [Hongsoonwoonella zoysiae]
MSVWPMLEDDEMPEASRAVADDIRQTRKTDFLNNFWRVLANDPALMKRTWESLKEIMSPGELDPLAKEMIYLAVSISNSCDYCISSHTAAARAKGMSEAQLGELLSVVGMASETNRLASALQVPVDEAFRRPPKASNSPKGE